MLFLGNFLIFFLTRNFGNLIQHTAFSFTRFFLNKHPSSNYEYYLHVSRSLFGHNKSITSMGGSTVCGRTNCFFFLYKMASAGRPKLCGLIRIQKSTSLNEHAHGPRKKLKSNSPNVRACIISVPDDI